MDLYLVAQSFWTNPASYLFIAEVCIGLGFVIFVHELGHFLVAKACGVKCEKFLIGFDAFDVKIAGKVIIPRKLISWTWGETEYALGIIPLGGYVKMLGQDDNPSKAAAEIERAKVRKQEENEAGDGGDDSADAAKSDTKGEYELDPRSYQAKSVPQRMAIISAGVIMNLIFGVIFAMIAYLIGVPFTPAVVGQTKPGGPAWTEDIQPALRIIVMGAGGKESTKHPFRDLPQAVAIHGNKEPFYMRLRVPDGEDVPDVEKYPLPRNDVLDIKGVDLPAIGLRPAMSTQLMKEVGVVPTLPAALTGEFEPGDKIIKLDNGLDGEKKITNSRELKEYLTLNADKTVVFTVERTNEESSETTTKHIQVPPHLMRRLGLAMKIGTISGIQKESPAVDKLEVGDLIVTVDGQPVGNLISTSPVSSDGDGPLPDPILLSLYLQDKARAGEEVTIRVMRTVGELKQEFKDVKLKPRLPISSPNYGGSGDPISIDELGIALPILNWVAAVEAGSPADKAIKPGDQITKVEFVLDEKWKDSEELKLLRNVDTPIDLVEEPHNWPHVHSRLQMMPPNTKIKLVYLRNGQQDSAEIEWSTSGSWGTTYNPTRGFFLEPMEEIRQAESLGEAFSLGLAQTGEDATRVFQFLRKLISGQISPTNLGGPLTIGVAATSEASVSPSRLLLFFTLLSANLAIVNFLPIPVLDGGHMVFLIYELIFRKPPNEKIFMGLTLVGFAFILSLMLFVIGLDVFRLANWF